MAKKTADLSAKHFSRYGEFLASFELSKYGWDNYASRVEKKGKSYAVDLRPRDLAQGKNHFYIWVCIDENEKANFLVIPLKKFEKEAETFINSISFLKDQGREHFNFKSFGKWGKYLNRFDLLD